MRNKWQMTWLLCLLGLSATLLLWHRFGMNRTLRLNSATDYKLKSYDDRDVGGVSVNTLEKTPRAIVNDCHLNSAYKWPYCGFSVALSAGTQGVDFSTFDTVSLDIRTSGPETIPVTIYLRNFNPAYATKGDQQSLKVNELVYVPNHEEHPLVLSLSNFQVPAWWINGRHIAAKNAAPDLRNITSLEVATGTIDKIADYTISVRSVVFHGKWLSQVQLLSIILGIWLLFAAVWLLVGFWQGRREIVSIRVQKQELEDINAALKLEQQELEDRATHDELTGLYNRAGLRNRLYDMVSGVKRHREALSAIFIDVDFFKPINDQHGHMVGDEVLRQLGNLIVRHTRDRDFVCRWGGEEFILFCGDTALEAARGIAEKLRVLIGEQRWPNDIAVTCSFGVAGMRANEETSRFLNRADEALYRAKENGRNRVCVDTGDDRVPLAEAS
jgi:diguanylate cyclase (GGDEF)-like protein